jgi:hypothetical protein
VEQLQETLPVSSIAAAHHCASGKAGLLEYITRHAGSVTVQKSSYG